jgi:protein-tyrosine-phosphatase
MESDILDGDRFLLVRDDLYSDEQLQQRITEEARSQADAIYTMTEMNHITSAELTDEDKRKLHDLKKEFGGQVLGDDPEGEAFPCVDISDWIDSRTG